MIVVITIIFYSCCFLILWQTIGYVVILEFLSLLIRRTVNQPYVATPLVSIIIPTYNEQRVILKKIANTLELEYPRNDLEIFVVDDASTDGTLSEILQFSGIQVIQKNIRSGKAASINLGISKCRGSIVLITDANAMLNKTSLLSIVRFFQDQSVGAVSGRFQPTADMSGESTIKKSFWALEKRILINESHFDSCSYLCGQISAIRTSIFKPIDEKNLAEDFDLCVDIRTRGYKILYDPTAISVKPLPLTFQDELVQRKRRIIGTIQTLIKRRRQLMQRKNMVYGFFIVGSHKLLQVLSPFILVLSLISLGLLALIGHTMVYLLVFICSVTLLLLGSLPGLFIRKNVVTKRFSFIYTIHYFLLLQLIVLNAWIDYFRGTYQVTWKQVDSLRDI